MVRLESSERQGLSLRVHLIARLNPAYRSSPTRDFMILEFTFPVQYTWIVCQRTLWHCALMLITWREGLPAYGGPTSGAASDCRLNALSRRKPTHPHWLSGIRVCKYKNDFDD